jgi:hypothetical protein
MAVQSPHVVGGKSENIYSHVNQNNEYGHIFQDTKVRSR